MLLPEALRFIGLHNAIAANLRLSKSDVIMFLHREECYHKLEKAEEMGIVGQADIMLVKHRNGPTGDLKFVWFPQYVRFAIP